MAAAFFFAAGRLDVPRAWLAFAVHFGGAIAGGVILGKYAPELANRRASAGKGTKAWDKAILVIYLSLVLIVIPVVAGLDVGRYKWSILGAGYVIIGIILYLVFFILLYWSIVVNEHFETTSRIQGDRCHKVVVDGPYRLVRHPGYVSLIILCFVGPLMIGSLYSLIPSVLASIVMIIRTGLEDKMLRDELEGYSEYASRIRYRLMPGVW